MANGINHDTASKLLGITPAELSDLVRSGAINRNAKDDYALAVIVRDYINHLKSTLRYADQKQIAEHLDMSDRNVREIIVTKLGINHKTTDLDTIRISYIRHLREQASGRGTGSGDLDLVTERAALAREQKIRVQLQNAVTQREYAPIIEMELGLASVMAAIGSQLDSIPGKLKKASDKLTITDINVIESVLCSARTSIADMVIDWFGDLDNMDSEDANIDSDLA